MAADEQRILKAESGKEYNVSFRPAILNRKYHKRWTEYQAEIIKGLKDFMAIKAKAEGGTAPTDEEQAKIEGFTKLAEDASQAGIDLIVYAMRANGYKDFDEEELYNNFSVEGIAKAINFIMGLEKPTELKKKAKPKKANS